MHAFFVSVYLVTQWFFSFYSLSSHILVVTSIFPVHLTPVLKEQKWVCFGTCIQSRKPALIHMGRYRDLSLLLCSLKSTAK